MSASSLTVSVSVPPNARTLRAMVPCFCCLTCLPPARLAGFLLPCAQKVTITRAPPARSPSSSPSTSEVAGRLVLAVEEGPEREQRRKSAVAGSDDDMVVVVMCRTVRGCVRPVQRSILYVW